MQPFSTLDGVTDYPGLPSNQSMMLIMLTDPYKHIPLSYFYIGG